MTPRENFLAYFSGEKNLWMPTSQDCLRFSPVEIPENRARGLVKQANMPDISQYGGPDWFGVDWYFDPPSGGAMERNRLLEDFNDWERIIHFPDLEAFDWEACRQTHSDYLNTDKVIVSTIYSGYLERLISFAGFENAAIALLDEEQEDAIRMLFDHLTDHYARYVRLMHRHFGAEHFVIHDDWGSQRSLLLAPRLYDEMIFPFIRALAEAVHKDNCTLEMHSCGKIDRIIPGLIQTGVDSWCGQNVNDKAALVREYGEGFKFCVGICEDPEPLTDEQCMLAAEAFVRDYRGTNVWCYIGRAADPRQKQMVADRIHELI